MVASVNSDLYSPFQHPMFSEDGPQSSEESSGLHSPVFGAQYSTHGHNVRYQHDHLSAQQAAGILAPQYDYAHPLPVQQPPILDATIDLHSPSARQITFSSHPTLSPRNQLGQDFPVQHSVNSRIPPTAHGGVHIDFTFHMPERRLSGATTSHAPSYSTRNIGNPSGMSIAGDHRSSAVVPAERTEASTSTAASNSKGTRKETSPVVIACCQCRLRKIRCDSTRPVCNNCLRRANPCEYDAAPKRRGPDKHPGLRKRGPKKRPAPPDSYVQPAPKRRKSVRDPSESQEAPPEVKEIMGDAKGPSSTARHQDRLTEAHRAQPSQSPTGLRIITEPALPIRNPPSPTSFPRYHDESAYPPHRKFPVPNSPAVETEQRIWWDKILRGYSIKEIVEEFTFLIDNTGHLLSFISINFLYGRLSNTGERLRTQPSFILAALAMAKLMKSSSVEESTAGLQQALNLKTDAHTAFEDAWRVGWIDATLAEAALILALFETSAHPDYSHSRAAGALLTLDEIMRNIQLTTNDINDHDVCTFPPNAVPTIIIDYGPEDPLHPLEQKSCLCLPPDPVNSPGPYITRNYILPWNSSWDPNQYRDEEIRRLCWSSLSLISDYSSQCAAFNREPPKLYLTDPVNYALLFPGEVIDRETPTYRATGSMSPKESVWALFCRSMLLWNFCNRFRQDQVATEDISDQVQEAWIEVQSIQDSLDLHRCNIDTTIIYMCREYVYNTQMLITQALRRLVPFALSLHGLDSGLTTTPGPIFKRKHAEDWLYYQDQVIRRVHSTIHNLTGPDGHQLTRRPFRVTWFINQLSICLVLWSHDRSLHDALKLGKMILQAVDVMNALWPCPVNQHQSDVLRQRIIDACTLVGMDLPFSPSYSLPPFITTS